MKTKLLFVVLLGVLMLGCKDDDLDIPDDKINITAKINNAAWKGRANGMVNVVSGRTVYAIGGAWTDGSAISITFEPFIATQLVGTYDITALALYTAPTGTVYQSTTGTLQITSFTGGNTISGTFSFNATDRQERDGDATVTEGVFTGVEIR